MPIQYSYAFHPSLTPATGYLEADVYEAETPKTWEQGRGAIHIPFPSAMDTL
jgi:hypothetical protein